MHGAWQARCLIIWRWAGDSSKEGSSYLGIQVVEGSNSCLNVALMHHIRNAPPQPYRFIFLQRLDVGLLAELSGSFGIASVGEVVEDESVDFAVESLVSRRDA
jgi:hypothetical protein